MANPLSNEEEIFARIKEEKISVHPLIWQAIYQYVGDSISVINLIITNFVDYNEPIPVDDSRNILKHTGDIKAVFDKIVHTEKIVEREGIFKVIKDKNVTLDPLIKELFAHYIANDNCAINFCVSFYLDPGYEEEIPLKEAKKMLVHAKSMSDFLDKLREHTVEEKAC